MKYKESQILLDVRKIKERLHETREREGTEAFLKRINRRVKKPVSGASSKLSKKKR